jgi:nucleoside-diphosphate-sugar epimerase
MRCVVTGGAGFLGSHLCERVMDRGDVVVCVDNLITGSMENLGHLLGRELGHSARSSRVLAAGRPAGSWRTAEGAAWTSH